MKIDTFFKFLVGFMIVIALLTFYMIGAVLVVATKGCNMVEEKGLKRTIESVWEGPNYLIITNIPVVKTNDAIVIEK